MNQSGEPFSNDSLLDTLTCFAGVLIIILALTQIMEQQRISERENVGAGEAATSGQLEQDGDRLAKLQEELDAARDRWNEAKSAFASNEQRKEKLIAAIEDLRAGSMVEAQRIRAEAHKAEQARHRIEPEADALDHQIASRTAQIERMQRTIDEAPQATTIYLPEVRTIEKDLEPVTFYCRRGQVFSMDMQELANEFREGVEDAAEQLTPDMSPAERLGSLIDYFDENDIGNEMFRLDLLYVTVDGEFYGLSIRSYLREGVTGETTSQLRAEDSAFTKAVRAIDPDEQYISFHVWGDSFDTYLAARRLAEDLHADEDAGTTRIGASWAPYDPSEEFRSFWDILNNEPDGSDGTIVH